MRDKLILAVLLALVIAVISSLLITAQTNDPLNDAIGELVEDCHNREHQFGMMPADLTGPYGSLCGTLAGVGSTGGGGEA